jgi:hypothetical protein
MKYIRLSNGYVRAGYLRNKDALYELGTCPLHENIREYGDK